MPIRLLLTAALLLPACLATAQILPQTDAERIQAETRRIEQEREQRFQEQQRERREEAERQDRHRQQELRRQERTPPSSRPTPLLPERKVD
jgi:outer membrane biogenesis lipoprotein LolB